ncbi:hypothetical protein [Hansschlegelia beijingensis]|uniref:Uncharacterized protein n=1 Tax=Hansschlegelia beijingensis TaxID=1133344 RepID=A0A7W6D2A5_9HYPH|nr:hypothetical protein [Hansschlegelia beijingensis]MBB3972792.1 hypothetical protein [Hansschlegelia beijingensis]
MTDVIKVIIDEPQVIKVIEAGPQGPAGPAADTSALLPRAGLAAAKDAADLTAMQSDAEVLAVFLQSSKTYDIGSAIPAKPVFGPGKLVRSGATLGGFQPAFDAYRCNSIYAPDDPIKALGFPATPGHYSTIYSPGSKAHLAARLTRSTLFGVRNIENPGADVDRVDLFGDGAGRRMMFGERITGLGTIALEQAGAQEFTGHNFWFDGGGSGVAIAPGSPGWDYQGLETRNPGIGAKILAAAVPAASRAEVAYLTAVSRDAMNLTIKGVDSFAGGYRALAYNFLAYRSNAIGTDIFRDGVFLKEATGMGHRNGMQWQEGSYVGLFGTYNAFATVRGSNVFMLGRNNAGNVPDINGSVLIGIDQLNAGAYTSLADVFALGTKATPLLAGKFDTGRVGINCLPENVKRRLHIFESDSGCGTPASLDSGSLVIERNTHTGILVQTPNTSIAGIYFGDPEDDQAGGFTYHHGTDQARVRAGATNIAFFSTTAINIAAPIFRSGSQVVNTRKTGWGTATGTATRTTFNTATVTLPQLAERVKALLDDLHFATAGHGLIGA